ncbi:MAG: hypothetical protein EA380_09850 [Phycisphaeraceae bacterium]|nr:MAG: hypothetical protein EA380_09850 [Phycisphaeraceae bacterium]
MPRRSPPPAIRSAAPPAHGPDTAPPRATPPAPAPPPHAPASRPADPPPSVAAIPSGPLPAQTHSTPRSRSPHSGGRSGGRSGGHSGGRLCFGVMHPAASPVPGRSVRHHCSGAGCGRLADGSRCPVPAPKAAARARHSPRHRRER